MTNTGGEGQALDGATLKSLGISPSYRPSDPTMLFFYLEECSLIVPSAESGKFDFTPEFKRRLMTPEVGVYVAEALVHMCLAEYDVISKATLAWWDDYFERNF